MQVKFTGWEFRLSPNIATFTPAPKPAGPSLYAMPMFLSPCGHGCCDWQACRAQADGISPRLPYGSVGSDSLLRSNVFYGYSELIAMTGTRTRMPSLEGTDVAITSSSQRQQAGYYSGGFTLQMHVCQFASDDSLVWNTWAIPHSLLPTRFRGIVGAMS